GALVLVLALSLALLCYVAFGEAYRTYPKFEMEHLGAQGEIVKQSMDTYLLAGLPLEQFPGFPVLTQPLLDTDAAVSAIYVSDLKGQTVFANQHTGGPPPDAAVRFDASTLQRPGLHYQITENGRS